MAKELVIVESPAKARTIGRILGSNYDVKASIGHVRDLPRSQLGVDVERGFRPKYVIPKGKREVIQELKQAAKKASKVYLATDPDREGEAISWHLVQAAELEGAPVQRIVFHEITKEAVEKALRQPREIDMHLVNAQQARRILDRLVGYKISPLLWRKVRRGLSAGRVQSAALKMIVDREREIQSFVPIEYWSIEAELAKKALAPKTQKAPSFKAALIGPLGKRQKFNIASEEEAHRLVSDLEKASYAVSDIRSKDLSRRPAPPFTTSTLQQEAWRRLHYTAKRTMAIAQQLYEGLPLGDEGPVGLITYMRTDSVAIATSARTEARAYIAQKYGAEYIPPSPRLYTKKSKGAQEAHEAIRPTSARREPAHVKAYLTPEQFRLYDLIWRRMVASQMANATLETTTVDIEARQTPSGINYLLRASSSKVKFPGFLAVYSEETEGEKRPLPPLSPGEPLDLLQLLPEQHFTQPPPRYTEGTLVKALEEKGIGRPSTYATILSTIQERRYVEKADGKFAPLELGIIVSDLLAQYFADIVDYDFTAQMEEELDEIARGEREWVPVLRQFYTPFQQKVEEASAQIEKVKVTEEPSGEICEKCGKPMVVKLGRYGKFLACTGYPDCKNTRPILIKTGVKCPRCGGEIVEKRSKRRRLFYGCANYPKCDFTLWERPLPQPCPDCGGILTANGKNAAKCTECGHKIDVASFREGSEEALTSKV
ncbi:MAG: DNA topoisomerase I [Chloroflexi bacterium RBG_13_54_9]|nr:MAG: DNA topoisomerase I [Chloroflexi bacterium RBG_13_54_9]